MESNQDMETMKEAIHRLIEEKRIKDTSSDVNLSQDDEQQLLSRLLSQLESLKEGSSTSLDKPITKTGNEEENGEKRAEEEDIVKELKAVRRQNTITHCLLSALIVVTLIWEFSEVSMFLKLQNGLNHPFKSFGNWFAGMLSSRGVTDGSGTDSNDDDPMLPSVRMPELPHVEFPPMGSNGEQQ
ncbi:hypothetical protein F3Y22_tig00117048pilonHSYRG00257 [Hibiscus syriacus]|uniref:Uncharacterized protein n=2 Tax=Hibiscus syriacus TaxID=106335 RepID=A0A6A2WAB4_HIBSY|nr:hypothetical protein F3Y22_tig00117048pilonHSYRG00257 [Hibiscus syriacus]